jgi:hypothetical protein
MTLGHAEGLPAVEGPPGAVAVRNERDKLAVEVARLVRERDGFSAEVRKLEAKVAAAEAAADARPANGTNGAHAAAEGIAAYGSEPVATLGLDEKVLKVLRKLDITTVGGLCDAYRADDKPLTGAKLTKDQLIDIGERLLGRVPPAAVARAIQGDAAPASAGSGAPAEHIDRSWPDRIGAARRKEEKFVGAKARAETHRGELLKRWPACIGLDAEGQEAVKSPKGMTAKDIEAFEDLRHHYTVESGVAEVLLSQVQALLWGCGLTYDDNDASAVDGSLKRAGLVHLMAAAPAPAGDDDAEAAEAEVEEPAGAEAE